MSSFKKLFTSAIAGYVLLLSIATTTFSGTIMLMGIGGVGSSAPLDGVTVTLALSMSRKLVSTYTGAFYNNGTGSVIDTWNDQSGSANNLTAVTTARPAVTTGGPNNIAAAGFDGVNDYINSGIVPISSLISASTGWIIACIIPNTITANNPNVYDNVPVFGDAGGFMGVYLKNTGTPKSAITYNNDGSIDVASSATITPGAAPYVIEWIHSGGNAELWINGLLAATTPSGNTANLSGIFGLGNSYTGSSVHLDGLIFELAASNAVPATHTAIAANFMTQCGVPTCSNSLDFSQACNSQYVVVVF